MTSIFSYAVSNRVNPIQCVFHLRRVSFQCLEFNSSLFKTFRRIPSFLQLLKHVKCSCNDFESPASFLRHPVGFSRPHLLITMVYPCLFTCTRVVLYARQCALDIFYSNKYSSASFSDKTMLLGKTTIVLTLAAQPRYAGPDQP